MNQNQNTEAILFLMSFLTILIASFLDNIYMAITGLALIVAYVGERIIGAIKRN